jgi:exodeoxyribonuclease VII large subunit
MNETPVTPQPDRPKVYPLSAVTRAIENALKEQARTSFWVQAEVTSPRLVGGHQYATLVEQRDGTTIAKMHCVIWESTLRKIRSSFTASGLTFELAAGTQVCLQCRIAFSPVYGLSLTVLDADPRFVIGEMELRKRELMDAMRKEGADVLNKRHVVPVLPLRIGLVTSGEGDALNDIVRLLAASRYGFTVLLADSFMQGENAGRSILKALDTLEALAPDLIVIARGGGNRTDLAWLDAEPLARRIAACGLPVWTGIGHANDSSVLDLVAHTAFETPTAVAKAIIARFDAAATRTVQASDAIRREWHHRLAARTKALADDAVGIRQGTRKLAAQARTSVKERADRLELIVDRALSRSRRATALAAQRVGMRAESVLRFASSTTALAARLLRSTAMKTHGSSGERLSVQRTRLDPQRIASILAVRKSDAARRAHAVDRSAVAALHLRMRVVEHAKRSLMRGSFLVRLDSLARRLADRLRLLDAHDPRRALERGYAIVSTAEDRIVTSTASIAAGDELRVLLRDGRLNTIVRSITLTDADNGVGIEADGNTESKPT